MKEAIEGFREIIKKRGHRVEEGTPYCKQFRETHENCVDCESEKGCSIYIEIMGILCESMSYKPTSYKDTIETNKLVQERIQKALKGERIWGK